MSLADKTKAIFHLVAQIVQTNPGDSSRLDALQSQVRDLQKDDAEITPLGEPLDYLVKVASQATPPVVTKPEAAKEETDTDKKAHTAKEKADADALDAKEKGKK